ALTSVTPQASVPSASSRTPIPRTYPNKMECLYQCAVEHGLDPEKFSIITEADKKRWAGEFFCGILEVDISRKNDGEELLHCDILKHRSSTAWLDDLMKEWEKTHTQFI
ncbi:15723_t:CDS:2, partial [Funneliformis caledonium]